ncbi:MAG: hypothetical protein MUE41_06620 [Gemmatimonadaceae bacterium]|nr:hypothetical protein [Gemmatimonadaceae bacterium]
MPHSFLPDVFELHVEELGFLRRQRRAALVDPERTWKSLCELDARLDAHVAGTVAIGVEMPPRLRPALEGDDDDRAFAAALALLRARDVDGTRTLLGALATAEGDRLAAFSDALAMAAPPPLLPHLLPIARAGDPLRAIALLAVIALRGGSLPDDPPLDPLIASDDPLVASAAWRLAAHRGTAVSDTVLQRALTSAPPPVRRVAVDAAIWLRTPWLLDLARQRLAHATPDDLPLLGALALLGEAADREALTHRIADATFGPARFELARLDGSADGVERCIAAMVPSDPEGAAAAGRAFWRITGESCAGPTRVSLAPPDASAFDQAFADEVVLPDADEARRRWTRIRRGLRPTDRLVHGVPVGAPLDAAVLGRFDVISRRELYQRARWAGSWAESPLTLEAFPQRG